jgi:hypothetical protein
MPQKFQYAPGLPGYGTKGVDGSSGLQGIATYFSGYNGNSDSVTIKSKIIANKELFSGDDYIPGYPIRVYQTGDVFIDKDARIFQIDFDEPNLYKDTGIFLNTSGFFETGPTQTAAPGFQRFSNAFTNEQFLIDSVYSLNAGDYTTKTEQIYDTSNGYFARVNYVGNDITPNFKDRIFPFAVWIANDGGDFSSIALMREYNNNIWHLGNKNGGVQRDVSLVLDFNRVTVSGDLYADNIYGTIQGSIETNDIVIGGHLETGTYVNVGTYLNVGGNITSSGSISASNFSGSHSGTSSGTNTGDNPGIVTLYAGNGMNFSTISGSGSSGTITLGIPGTSSTSSSNSVSSTSHTHDIDVTLTDSGVSGVLPIEKGGTEKSVLIPNSILRGNGPSSIIDNGNLTYQETGYLYVNNALGLQFGRFEGSGHDVNICVVDSTPYQDTGHSIAIQSGNGGFTATSHGAQGGWLRLYSGDGGDQLIPGTDGGGGGPIFMVSGNGGDANSGVGGDGGDGGDIVIYGGSGGDGYSSDGDDGDVFLGLAGGSSGASKRGYVYTGRPVVGNEGLLFIGRSSSPSPPSNTTWGKIWYDYNQEEYRSHIYNGSSWTVTTWSQLPACPYLYIKKDGKYIFFSEILENHIYIENDYEESYDIPSIFIDPSSNFEIKISEEKKEYSYLKDIRILNPDGSILISNEEIEDINLFEGDFINLSFSGVNPGAKFLISGYYVPIKFKIIE